MTDELTEHGILTDSGAVSLLDYVSEHGQPVHVGPDCVVFRDEHGHELSEWADIIGTDARTLSERMHDLARDVYGRTEATGSGDPWSAADPVVFDADTFRRDSFEALALLLRRGCSPAAALDWFATEENHWSQTDWAAWRGVSQQNVSGNVSKARDILE
jgi:hypothetical protein